MKLCIIIIFLSIFLGSCSPKLIPVGNGKFHYYKKKSFLYSEIDIELYANDSIKVSTKKGHNDVTCSGLIKRIKNNTYQIICYDKKHSSKSLSDLLVAFNLENDTLVYNRSYVKFWGVKLKRVAPVPR